MVRYELLGLGATWTDEYGIGGGRRGARLAAAPTRRTTTSRDGVDYPAVLFTIFDGDTRVDPLHARKMAAALQHATTATAPVLLRRESDVGHGARAVSRAVELSVDTLTLRRRTTPDSSLGQSVTCHEAADLPDPTETAVTGTTRSWTALDTGWGRRRRHRSRRPRRSLRWVWRRFIRRTTRRSPTPHSPGCLAPRRRAGPAGGGRTHHARADAVAGLLDLRGTS